MKQRLRITYSVTGPLRYISNLEQMRVWERAARRAGLPLAYSGGFTPRPRLQIAAPLPVGFAARAERIDLWMDHPVEPAVAAEALAPTLPQGLTIRSMEEVELDTPAMQSQLEAAEYRVMVETTEEVRDRVADLMAEEHLLRRRRGRRYDLRPLIHWLEVEEEQPDHVFLRMRLAAREGATGRPEEVLDALGLADAFFRIRREQLLLADEI